jgi:hypothetical protein
MPTRLDIFPDGFVNAHYLESASTYRWIGYSVDYLNRRTRLAWTLGYVIHTPQRFVEPVLPHLNAVSEPPLRNRVRVVGYANVLSVDGIVMQLRSSSAFYVGTAALTSSFPLKVTPVISCICTASCELYS